MPELSGDLPTRFWAGLAIGLNQKPDCDVDTALAETGATLAAVLLLLYEKDAEPHIVFTRRTNRVATHKGEVSLPGGAYEPDKDRSLQDTALREAMEEIGLTSHAVHVLGRLPLVHTLASNFMIAPFVAATNQSPRFSADPTEVAEVLEVPLAVLRDPSNLRQEQRILHGVTQVVPFYAHGPHKIWGATARILDEFLSILDLTV